MFTKTHRSGIVLAVAIASALTLTLTGGRAEAGIGEMLVFACASDSGVDAAEMNAAVATCGATSGKKSACQVLSGTPWACNTPDPQDAADQICDDQTIEVTITGSLSMPAGWSVTGNISAKMHLRIEKRERKTCEADVITPPPTGNAGSFVSEKFRVRLHVSFTVSGGFTLTFTPPVGPPFSIAVSASAGCSKTMWKDAYIPQDTLACAAPTTTTSTGDATTSHCCTIEEVCGSETVCGAVEDEDGCTTVTTCRPEEVCMPCEPTLPEEPGGDEPVEPPHEPIAPMEP